MHTTYMLEVTLLASLRRAAAEETKGFAKLSSRSFLPLCEGREHEQERTSCRYRPRGRDRSSREFEHGSRPAGHVAGGDNSARVWMCAVPRAMALSVRMPQVGVVPAYALTALDLVAAYCRPVPPMPCYYNRLLRDTTEVHKTQALSIKHVAHLQCLSRT